jgi:hypothetical protein
MPTWPTSPQGLDDPKLVFQALPATLRGRQYADLLTSTHPAAAGAHPRHNSRTSLRRLGSVDTGLEATPRQVSEWWVCSGRLVWRVMGKPFWKDSKCATVAHVLCNSVAVAS